MHASAQLKVVAESLLQYDHEYEIAVCSGHGMLAAQLQVTASGHNGARQTAQMHN